MSNPPASPPSSDVDGVNRDARAGAPAASGKPDPGAALDHARDESKAKPKEAPASDMSGGDV